VCVCCYLTSVGACIGTCPKGPGRTIGRACYATYLPLVYYRKRRPRIAAPEDASILEAHVGVYLHAPGEASHKGKSIIILLREYAGLVAPPAAARGAWGRYDGRSPSFLATLRSTWPRPGWTGPSVARSGPIGSWALLSCLGGSRGNALGPLAGRSSTGAPRRHALGVRGTPQNPRALCGTHIVSLGQTGEA